MYKYFSLLPLVFPVLVHAQGVGERVSITDAQYAPALLEQVKASPQGGRFLDVAHELLVFLREYHLKAHAKLIALRVRKQQAHQWNMSMLAIAPGALLLGLREAEKQDPAYSLSWGPKLLISAIVGGATGLITRAIQNYWYNLSEENVLEAERFLTEDAQEVVKEMTRVVLSVDPSLYPASLVYIEHLNQFVRDRLEALRDGKVSDEECFNQVAGYLMHVIFLKQGFVQEINSETSI